MKSIELAQALQLFHHSTAIFLDVRPRAQYDYGHIRGALNYPYDNLPELVAKNIMMLTEAQAVVVYCNGTSCGLAYSAARICRDQGIDNVVVYAEGWPEWKSCLLPVEPYKAAHPQERALNQ